MNRLSKQLQELQLIDNCNPAYADLAKVLFNQENKTWWSKVKHFAQDNFNSEMYSVLPFYIDLLSHLTDEELDAYLGTYTS